MPPGTTDPVGRISAALEHWRQGDVALEESWFVHAGDPSTPLSAAASEHDGAGVQGLVSEVDGLVVVTQTCDIVRSCSERPYVEVSPLIEVDEDELHHIARGRQPSRAFIPGLEDKRLVADLDRVMTVEKSIVARWTRTDGCRTDDEARLLARALGRKRDRFAFPNEFHGLMKKLRARLTDKHERGSPEGSALRGLREIRVAAIPTWTAPSVELFFFFIRDGDTNAAPPVAWPTHLATWLNCMPPTGTYTSIDGIVTTLDDMTASDYVHSDLLDLEHLSQGE